MKRQLLLISIMLFQGLLLFSQREITSSSIQSIDTVFDYEYAPGQHALNYAAGADGSDFKGSSASSAYVLLGGWGGHVDAGFDHSVYNIGGYDFGVFSQPGSGNEPGVVYVMQDVNNNGAPDDTWYELTGSETDSSGYIRSYKVTYYKPETTKNTTSKVIWKDNQGNQDTLNYAKWWDDTKDSVTYTGTKLPDNKYNSSGSYWADISGRFTYGYAENYSADDYNSSGKYNQFDISNSIDSLGNPVDLNYIDFIKVQTGCFLEAGWLGEVSTEVSGAIDLTMENYSPALFEEFTLEEESAIEPDYPETTSETDTSLFISGNFMYKSYGTNWGAYTFWYGVGISNKTDNTSAGSYTNEFNSAAGGDITGSGNYAVVYDSYSTPYDGSLPVEVNIIGHPEGETVSGLYITNNTYATTSMENGDGFAKKFGGDDGTDADYFKVIAEGFDAEGNSTGTNEFYLADFRFDDSNDDYIVKEWKWFDLSSLGEVIKIQFTMESSDAGVSGINTPLYYCVDNINYSGFEIENPLADISVNIGAYNDTIDLSSLFTYEYGDVSISLIADDVTKITTTSIRNDSLIIDYAEDTGLDTLIIQGSTTSGIVSRDTVLIAVCSNPSMNESLADITVDEDAPYDTINIKDFFTYSENAFVTISTKETQLSGENIVDPYVYGDSVLVLKYEENAFGQSKVSLTCIANSDTLTDTLLLTINSVQDTVYLNSSIPDYTKNEDYSGGDYSIYIKNTFVDDDGDEITKTIECIENTEIMTAEIRDNGKYIDFYFEQDSTGTSTFVLTGTTPDGLFAVDTFSFTLTPVDDAPFVANAIDSLTNYSNTTDRIDISTLFSDVDNKDADIEKAITVASDTDIATTEIVNDTLIVNYLVQGSTSVTIQGTSNEQTATETIKITVSDDMAPIAIASVNTVSKSTDATDTIIDLSDLFDYALSYEAISSDNSVASASVDEGYLTIDFLSAGQTNIIVIASAKDKADTLSFVVGVYPEIAGDYEIVDFENLTLESESYWNGSDGSGSFTSSLAKFNNVYTTSEYGDYWSGWAYSNMANDTTAGYTNQYSAITANGFTTSDETGTNYGLTYVYPNSIINFNDSAMHEVKGLYVTNSTYAALSMKQGDSSAKKFGGDSGDDEDWFKLLVWGMKDDTETDTIDFYLADFRFEDNTKDYIIETWQWLDLSSLGKVDSLLFELSSSDNSEWGMNTPSYFCVDDIYIAPAYNPTVENPITDIEVYENAEDSVIDLSAVFTDPDDEDSEIVKTVEYNSNNELVTASISNDELTLSFTANSTGDAEIVIMAESAGQTVTDTFNVSVMPFTAIEDLAYSLNIFPNPSNGQFIISSQSSELMDITIFDIRGRIVYQNPDYSSNQEVNISDKPAGSYIINIRFNNTIIRKRILKQ